MIKVFCDGCNEEIERNFIGRRLKRTLRLNGKEFTAEVMIQTNRVYNSGHLCLSCVLKIVNEGKE